MRRLLCAQGRLPGRARGLGGTLLSARLPGWQPEHVDSSLLPAPPYQLGHLEPMPPQVWGAAAASQEGAAPPRPIRAARLALTAAGRGPRGPPFSPTGAPRPGGGPSPSAWRGLTGRGRGALRPVTRPGHSQSLRLRGLPGAQTPTYLRGSGRTRSGRWQGGSRGTPAPRGRGRGRRGVQGPRSPGRRRGNCP